MSTAARDKLAAIRAKRRKSAGAAATAPLPPATTAAQISPPVTESPAEATTGWGSCAMVLQVRVICIMFAQHDPFGPCWTRNPDKHSLSSKLSKMGYKMAHRRVANG